MSTAVLIPDIIDLIVDYVVEAIEDYLKTPSAPYRHAYPPSIRYKELKECALINKAFTSRSQKYFFSTLNIWHDSSPYLAHIPPEAVTSPVSAPVLDDASLKTVHNLLEILEHKPYLAAHIRVLNTCAQFGHVLKLSEPLSKLFEILQSHGNPRTVDIYALDAYRPKASVQSTAFRNASHLTCKISDAARCNHYLSLLSQITPAYKGNAPTVQLTTPRPRLKNLFLLESWTVLEVLLGSPVHSSAPYAPIDFSQLEKLHLTPSAADEDVQSVQRLLSVCGSSIKELAMHCDITEATAYSRPLDLSECFNVHTARFIATIHATDDMSRSQLAETLSTIPNPNSITDLTIEVVIFISKEIRSQTYADEGWDCLDEQIDRIASSSSFPKFNCTIRLEFFRFHLDREQESGALVTQECAQLADKLKNVHFIRTTSNKRVDFQVAHCCFVDHLY
ncbi:hypothetical protein CVT24_012017 [Panaeolus cyanescens]|uniref:F-box domain-containing protein n=1 Tax=Panaeolus cyanescens TaxID=181874 RepID=A0A409YND7_9AGAR|nr:hypothetical protein CVT24_012017 [Panaeolus cyanescens]